MMWECLSRRVAEVLSVPSAIMPIVDQCNDGPIVESYMGVSTSDVGVVLTVCWPMRQT